MTALQLARRGGALLAAVAIAASLIGCAPEPEIVITPPTMAPEQTLEEACATAREAVDEVTLEVEQQIKDGIDAARQEVTAGRMPSFDFLSVPVDGTLAEIEDRVNNREVLAVVSSIRRALQGFGELPQPDSLLGVAALLTGIGGQLTDLSNAGKELRSLCGAP